MRQRKKLTTYLADSSAKTTRTYGFQWCKSNEIPYFSQFFI